ncbi:MAG: carboxylesterase, partial [Phenylobacterium sp.]|nr:carboxylesterase [Phenylobacterium sp.]
MARSRSASLGLGVAVGVALLAAGAAAAAPGPVVALESGAIAGEPVAGISIFRGIPYAAAPVGALRWRPPQRAAGWTGV